jgi:hypothetical protein
MIRTEKQTFSLEKLGVDQVSQIWMVYSSLNEQQKKLYHLIEEYLCSNKELQHQLLKYRFENGSIDDLDDDLKPHVAAMLGMMSKINEEYRQRWEYQFNSPQYD